MRAMKNSGIDWIGEVPENWEISKIGELYVNRNTKVSDKDYPPLSVTKNGILPQLENVAKSDAHDDRKLVKKGDFVINSRSDRPGSSGISDRDGSVSLINLVLEPRENMCDSFYNWLFHTTAFCEEFYKWGHGIVDDLWTTNWKDMKNISIIVPTIIEQIKISNYLDKEVSKINQVIKEVNETIKKYKEYKQSVITEVITNGLNSNVSKKESGIKWIGEIPENWNIIKIKFLPNSEENSFIDGDWIDSPYISKTGIRYLTTGNIGDGKFKNQGDGYITEETSKQLGCKFAYPGDLVFSRLNAPFGRSCILPEGEEKYILAVDNVILRTDNNKSFICYVSQCMGFQNSVFDAATGTTMKRVSRTNLGNIKMPIPPIEEQNLIVEFLDDKCSKIDSLIEEKQSLIKKLEDYKKSLIYECVTGKREIKE